MSLLDRLGSHPRLELGAWPTPLLRARRLEAAAGCGPLLVKRDDLSGFAVAGNKTRQLEYLVGATLEQGYDTLVTGGVGTSNFCQGAAVAARVAGLDCHLVVPGDPVADPAVDPPANLAIAMACGAHVCFTAGPRERLDHLIEQRAAELSTGGRRALAVPRGGATAVGSLGFARAAAELAEQLSALEHELGHDEVRVVVPVGSGGSIAGLLAGARALRLRWTVIGVSVSRPLDAITPKVHDLAAACAALLDAPAPRRDAVRLIVTRGTLHGPADDAELAAARTALQTEGLVLDSGYTARALLVALDQARRDGPPVVFWHTGGLVNAISDLAAGATT